MSESTAISSNPRATLLVLSNVDLTVDINEQASDCLTLIFTVTLRTVPPVVSPALASLYSASSEKLTSPDFNNNVANVEVLIFDDCGNQQLIILEFPVSFDSEEQTIAVSLSTDRCDITPGSWGRTFFVIADPFNRLAEIREGNNFAQSHQECIT